MTIENLLEYLLALPPGLIYLVIGVLAALENLIPPIPADTAVAIGAFLSGGGKVSLTAVFLITWSANVTSAMALYAAARLIGRPFFKGRLGRRLLKPKYQHRLEQIYHRHGTWGIFLSRFLPGVRAVIPPFAGIVGLGTFRAMLPIVVASGIWYGFLTLAAGTLVREVDEVVAVVSSLNLVAILAAVTVGVGIVVYIRYRRPKPEGRP